jgi:hypothetical protein
VPTASFFRHRMAWRRNNRSFEQLAATGLAVDHERPGTGGSARLTCPVQLRDDVPVIPLFGSTFTREEGPSNGPKALLLTDQFGEITFLPAKTWSERLFCAMGSHTPLPACSPARSPS